MWRWAGGLGMVLALAGGIVVVEPGFRVLAERRAAEDPVALAALRLPQALTPERLDAALAEALAARDAELARSLVDLAQDHGVAVADARLDALVALEADAAWHAAADFADGFVAGAAGGAAALMGAVAADVIGYGDLRDLFHEGRRIAAGGEPDPTTIAIGVAGIALTGAAWASLGSALPARGGLTLLKTADRSGALSPPMRASLARLGREAVDVDQAGRALAGLRRLDPAGARVALAASVRPAGIASLRGLAGDVALLQTRTGTRGVRQALALADDAGDLRRAARLAEAHGSRTRAILAMTGRGALAFGALSLSAIGTALGALLWLLGAAMVVGRIAELAARGLWRLGRLARLRLG